MTADSHRCQTIIGFAPTAAVGCAVFFLAEERPTCFFPYLTPLNYLIAHSEGMAIRSREAAAGKRESDAYIRDVPAARRHRRSRIPRSCWTRARSPRPSSTH